MSRDDRPAPRDEGAVLTLVLVLMVISALIVIPLLSYTVTVLRANQVVSDKTRDREAAEAGLRIALLDATDLFTQCIGKSRSVAMPGGGSDVVAGATVSVNCSLVDEINPTTDMGYGNPASAALQLGATVPEQFLGTVVQAPAVPPYPADPAWWSYTTTATTDEIWLPELPTDPGNDRDPEPFDMPASYNCKVFLPGSYDEAITISTGNVYFASGVYYFEQPVTISGDANVVVGYGTAELPNGCADDVQVGANLIDAPGVFGIDGAGATWVFGDEARLVVDNSATNSSLSLQFNQRYVQTGYEAERGQRISIISVNGDDTSSDDHLVPRVVSVPRSTVAVNDTTAHLDEAGAAYLPSDVTLTSEPIAPSAPAGVTVTGYMLDGAPWESAGVVVVEWDEVAGPDAGGALVDGYGVELRRGSAAWEPVCTEPGSIVPTADGRLGCVVRDRDRTGTYRVRVAAHNDAGLTSPTATTTPSTFELDGTLPPVAAPDAPTIGAVDQYAGAAQVTWTPGDGNGAPITGYRVSAQRVFQVAQSDEDDDHDDDDDGPVTYVEQYEELGTCATATDMWQAAATTCMIEGLLPIPAVDGSGNTNLGYRFVVTATNAAGTSAEAAHVPSPAVFELIGELVPPPVEPDERIVEPRIPDHPIVDLQLTNNVGTSVYVPGYIAVPMGRIRIDNEYQHDVQLIGGLLASTFDVDEVTTAGPVNSADIGYQSDVVLQRKIRLVSRAGDTAASAVVQINDDGSFAINSWVIQ